MVLDGFGPARASPGMESPEPPPKPSRIPGFWYGSGRERYGRAILAWNPPPPLPHPPIPHSPTTTTPSPLPHPPTPHQDRSRTARPSFGGALVPLAARAKLQIFSLVTLACLVIASLPGHRILAWSSFLSVFFFFLLFIYLDSTFLIILIYKNKKSLRFAQLTLRPRGR